MEKRYKSSSGTLEQNTNKRVKTIRAFKNGYSKHLGECALPVVEEKVEKYPEVNHAVSRYSSGSTVKSPYFDTLFEQNNFFLKILLR
jgi:hypothetical protein